MKKILRIFFITILLMVIAYGCKHDDNSVAAIVNKLDNNLNKLRVIVNNMDVIDNNTLSNPDIYSTINNDAMTNVSLASTEISAENLKEQISKELYEQLVENEKNNNCETCNSVTFTCKKYCDNNGDCYYKDSYNNCYKYNSDGTYLSCNEIPSTCEYIGQKILYNNESNGNANIYTTNTTPSILENAEAVIENNAEKSEGINTPNPRFMFYYSQDSFAPIKLKYNPRYVNEYSEETINNQIETYLFKVQKLYAMTEDTIEANNILHECKIDLIACIDDIKDLNYCIINGECEPSILDLQAIKSYIQDIKTTTKRLKDCNGELTKEMQNIAEENSTTLVNSVDVMNSNYLRLINHIDTRITYHKSAIATLEQIRYLLENSVNEGQIPEDELENIIDSLTIQDSGEDNIVSDENTSLNSESTNTTNTSVVNNNNAYNDNNSIDNEKNDIENEEAPYTNESTISENNEENKIQEDDNEDVLINDNVDEDLNNDDSSNVDETNNNTDDSKADDSVVIDSYSNNSWSNIDTYKDSATNNDKQLESNPSEKLEDNLSNTIDTSSNTSEENVSDITNQENIVPGLTTSTPIINDNLYTNSVITQNNLNNDDGYGGYFYTADGEIKNNGINNNNEIGNNGNTIETNMNKNNNVNTYGYNTMLDVINQGTVNNGINTL